MAKTMVSVTLCPWLVPNFVRVENHGQALDVSVPLREVDAEALSQMCDDFRASIFSRAGKADPKLFAVSKV